LGGVTSGGVFGLIHPALGANTMGQFIRSRFLETRRSSESLVPLIGFLTYLEPKLWIKIQKLVKNCTPLSC